MRMNRKYKKNGLIELMRFVFASIIIIFHVNKDLWNREIVLFRLGGFRFTPAQNGNIGVDFFFLVSGALMAMTIYRLSRTEQETSIGVETAGYIWKKCKQIWLYYLPICAVSFFVRLATGTKFGFWKVLSMVPSLLFLQRSGIGSMNLIGVAWYLSSMLIAMAILYPVCRKYYDMFTLVWAPVFGTLIIGALIKNTGTLGESNEWISVIYKTNIRAIADISLGTTCYELARRLKEQTFSERKRWLLTGIGFVTYGSAFVYICSNRSSTYGGIICLLLCIAVTISFSESGYFVHHQWFQNKFCMFLGSISLPMYLMQDVFRRLVPYCAAGSSKKVKALLIFFGTLVSAIVVKAIISFCAGRYLKKRTGRTDQAEKA